MTKLENGITLEQLIQRVRDRIVFLKKLQDEYEKKEQYKEAVRVQSMYQELQMLIGEY